MKKLNLILTAVTVIFLLQNILFAQPVSQLVLTGTDYNFFGRTVANAGDINGDGFDDIVIGVEGVEGHDEQQFYMAQVFFGGVIPHNSPDLELTGQTTHETGRSVSAAGDVNGDGYKDLLVGGTIGRTYIFFGGPHMDSIPDVTLTGDGGADYFGISVSGAGDVNNDGFDDVIVGAYNYQGGKGRASLFYGGANMDNVRDVIFEENNHQQYGQCVKGVGDINHDGFDDIMIGSTLTSGAPGSGGTGRAYIYYGGSNMDNIADKSFTDNVFGGVFGGAITASDINGDGIKDIIISGRHVGAYGGAFYVFYASFNNIDTIADVAIYNTAGNYNYFGNSISADDFNHDGYADIIVGAWGNNSDRGKVYVFYGGVSMDNTPDIIYIGENAGDKFGYSVSTAGNFNGDGKPGYIIGAPDYNSQSGRVYLFQNSIITSVNPDQNEINVSKSTDISVSFGLDMNSSTINTTNIKVFGLQTGLKSSTVSYNAGTRTATINPNSDFKVGEKIQVTLSSGIQTSSNTPITPFTWMFTVQALGGTGVFTEASIIDSAANINSYASGELLKSADIDGDGDMDLAAESYYSSSIRIFKNNGSGTFTRTQEIANIPDVHWYSALNMADYDNDGDIDISFSTATPISGIDSFYVYKNDGAGNFTKFSAILGGGLIANSADLDGDGDLDIAESWGYDKVRYLINDGYGNFTMYQINNLGYNHTNGCDVGDLDNDGNIDILVSIQSGASCKVVMLMNDGHANFTTGNSFLTSTYFSDQRLADLNGDKCLDIVGWNYIYFNLCNSTFSQTPFAAGSEAFPFDVDGDGDLDLTYTTGQFGGPNDQVKIYKNSGTGTFSNFSNTTVGHDVNSVASGDFDNDGDIDMAADNGLGHTGNRSDISILKNNYICTHSSYTLTGNLAIPVGSTNNVFVCSTDNGYWDISNYGNAHATIPEYSSGDSVVVSAGNDLGHFVLFYIAFHNCGGDTLLIKHVYIENPSSPLDFSISAIPEGFLNTFTNQLNARDTFSVYLRNRTAPYSLVDSVKSVLDSVTFKLQGSFQNAPTGLYFIVLKHRNSLETWSNSFGVLSVRGLTVIYDFTSSKYDAYGNNLALKGGLYCLYSGDADQDGTIDASDLSLVENAVSIGSSGYLNTDINADYYLDGSDISIVENNISKSIKSPLNGDFIYTPSEINKKENDETEIMDKIEKNVTKQKVFDLGDNYPNPFNPTTKINYELPISNSVSLKVFDMLGKEVASLVNEKQVAGKYTVEFNASSLPSGTYFYKIVAGDFIKVKKMILVK